MPSPAPDPGTSSATPIPITDADEYRALLQLKAPFGRTFNDFMAGYNADPAGAICAITPEHANEGDK